MFLRSNGIVLHYRLAGDPVKRPLVLLNSLGTDARIWDRVVGHLSNHFRIVSYDMRGHGLSDAPAGPYSLSEHVADLAGLMEYLEIKKAAVAGISVGGLVAQGFALTFPAKVTHLLISGACQKFYEAQAWEDRMAAIKRSGLPAIASTIVSRWFSEGYVNAHPDEISGWTNMFLRTPVAGYLGTCATLRDTDLTNHVASIKAPTLVTVGAADMATSPDTVRLAASRISDAEFEIITGAGHLPAIDQPVAFAATILGFLNKKS